MIPHRIVPGTWYLYKAIPPITKIIPIGMFFRASSVLLLLLAIYFAYEGVHELSEGLEKFVKLITPNYIS